MRRAFAALVALVFAFAAHAASDGELQAFAHGLGLKDQAGFVQTVQALDATGKLPARYLTKRAAERAGWRPGFDLCAAAPERAIGGDRFMNRERRLPEKQGRAWHEADLDFACGPRGARRLVYSNDGLRFVTVDHYASFHAVPR